MIGEIIDHLGIQIYHEIGMPDGSVIVHADPKEDHWRSVELANHNVFRLDAHNQVIW